MGGVTEAPDIVPDTERRGLVAALPAMPRDLVQLARFDRPIGWQLLYWPCAWGVALAGGAVARWDLLLWLLLGAVAMRGAGCVYNDIVDRDLDRRVERTRARPLASGRVSLTTACVWLVALSLVGLLVLSQLEAMAMLVALASLALVAVYPFMKRITWWPQAWLGLVFSWGALVGWADIRGELLGANVLDVLIALGLWGDGSGWPERGPWIMSWTPIFLYLGTIFWVIGYDTIYALQDIEDDALAGVKSSARRLGGAARTGVAVFYLAALAGWGWALWQVRPQPLALAALAPAALHLAWQVATLKPCDPADALAKFRSNRFAGLLVFLACFVVGETA